MKLIEIRDRLEEIVNEARAKASPQSDHVEVAALDALARMYASDAVEPKETAPYSSEVSYTVEEDEDSDVNVGEGMRSE